jgi:hypothetical protein
VFDMVEPSEELAAACLEVPKPDVVVEAWLSSAMVRAAEQRCSSAIQALVVRTVAQLGCTSALLEAADALVVDRNLVAEVGSILAHSFAVGASRVRRTQAVVLVAPLLRTLPQCQLSLTSSV